MEYLDVTLLDKHLLSDGKGSVTFLFEPDTVLIPKEDGEGFTFKSTKDVIDFGALMSEMKLESTVENMVSLVYVLLEKYEAGEMEEYA